MSIFTRDASGVRLRKPEDTPEVWRHVDAQPEPGPTSSTAARHHWHCLKLLRALSRFGALGGGTAQPSRVRDLGQAAQRRFATWVEIERHAIAACHSGPIGEKHNAVIVLAAHIGVPGVGTDYEAPCTVPTETELLGMAAECFNERGSQWEVLDESGAPPEQPVFLGRRQKLLEAGWQQLALSPESAVELDVLLDYAEIKRNGKLNEQVLDPLQRLGLLHRLNTNPPRWWIARAFGQPS